MFELRRHRALVKIAAIRATERHVAQQELSVATKRESEAIAAHRRAEAATIAAAAEWQDQIVTGGFHPELASALAVELNRRVNDTHQASADSAAMAEARDVSEVAWQRSTAWSRHAEDSVVASLRAIARDRDERALDAFGDRVSFDWTRQ